MSRRPSPGVPQFQPPEPLIERPRQDAERPRQIDAITGRKPAKVTRPAKAVRPAVKDEPPAEEKNDPTRPAEHNGVAVVNEELFSNLPTGAPFKVSKLHLVDGTVAHACRDCLFTGDTRTDVQHHRNAEHGTRYGKKTPKVVWEKDRDLGDLVLPPRGEQPAPTNPMEMTLAEFLALAPSYAALSDLIDRTERDRDAAVAKLNEMHDQNRDAAHALAVYPALQQEVVDLRLMVRNVGSYEELKSEVLGLRAFKKKILAKLEAVGFSFVDDETKEQ